MKYHLYSMVICIIFVILRQAYIYCFWYINTLKNNYINI